MERDTRTPDYYLKLMCGDLMAQVAVLRAACDQKDEEIARLKIQLELADVRQA
jgi:hypothetical protein